MASFDGGFGSAYLARQVGQKRAREIFFLGAEYSAEEAFEMGMVNKVVPHAELEQVAYDWAEERFLAFSYPWKQTSFSTRDQKADARAPAFR